MDTLKAEKREVFGRKISRLRTKGLLPSNVFGKKVKSLAITVDTKEFLKVYKEAGETGLIEITVGQEKRPVLVHNVQRHPVTDLPLHVDFLQVDLKEKVTAQVPVELTGESPAEKQGLGTVVQHINEIEVESLPGDIPESFEIDISNFTEVEQSVQVKDLKYDRSKVEVKAEPEEVVAKVEPPVKVEEELPQAPAAEEGVEGTPAEGGEEKAAEGGEEKAAPETTPSK